MLESGPMDTPESLRARARRWRDYAQRFDDEAARAFLEAAVELEKQADQLEAAQRKPSPDD